MKRTKKLPSRKAKTLRRGIVLAVCLVGILALYQPCLTPGQAIRASEAELGWEKPRSSPAGLPSLPTGMG